MKFKPMFFLSKSHIVSKRTKGKRLVAVSTGEIVLPKYTTSGTITGVKND
jgi:hypothetical protein